MAEDQQRTIIAIQAQKERIISVPALVIIVILPIVFLIAFCIYTYWKFTSSQSTAQCENEVSEITFSPDNRYKAVSFLQNCGATEAYNPGVSILPAKDEFKPTKTSGVVFLCYCCGCTKATWQSNTKLLINYCWPEATGLQFKSPDDFLKVQEKHFQDVDVSLQLAEDK